MVAIGYNFVIQWVASTSWSSSSHTNTVSCTLFWTWHLAGPSKRLFKLLAQEKNASYRVTEKNEAMKQRVESELVWRHAQIIHPEAWRVELKTKQKREVRQPPSNCSISISIITVIQQSVSKYRRSIDYLVWGSCLSYRNRKVFKRGRRG